jgi:hypothetical protein
MQCMMSDMRSLLFRIDKKLDHFINAAPATVFEAYGIISKQIEEIVGPLAYSTNHGTWGGQIMPPGYLRNTIRPSADFQGIEANTSDECRLDDRVQQDASAFLRKYLQGTVTDAANAWQTSVKEKVDTFFQTKPLGLWPADPDLIKEHILYRLNLTLYLTDTVQVNNISDRFFTNTF